MPFQGEIDKEDKHFWVYLSISPWKGIASIASHSKAYH